MGRKMLLRGGSEHFVRRPGDDPADSDEEDEEDGTGTDVLAVSGGPAAPTFVDNASIPFTLLSLAHGRWLAARPEWSGRAPRLAATVPLPDDSARHIFQRWVEARFHAHGRCCRPVLQLDAPEPVCVCGRALPDHPEAGLDGLDAALPPADAPWSAATHAPTTPTQTYGLLFFQDQPADPG